MAKISTFEAEINGADVKITLQHPGNFAAADISCFAYNKDGDAQYGTFVKKCIEREVVVAPKNMMKILEESDSFSDIVTMFSALNMFLASPKRFQEHLDDVKRKEELEKAKLESACEDVVGESEGEPSDEGSE